MTALLKELKLSGRSDAGANLANANARAVIYFPEGRFVLHNDDDNVVDPTSANQKYTDSKGNNRSEEIFIRGGYFVLKGAGRGKTTLVMDTPNLPNNSEQMWSSPMMINIKHNSGLSDLTTVTGRRPHAARSRWRWLRRPASGRATGCAFRFRTTTRRWWRRSWRRTGSRET